MKSAFLFIAVLLSLLTAIVSAAHVYLLDGVDGLFFSILDEEDTVYSAGYSDSAFRKIRPGMSEADVHEVLRAPLGEVWIYGSVPPTAPADMVSFSGDFVDHIDPTKSGIAGWRMMSIGMRKTDVLQLVGEPLGKSFVYSKSQFDQSHRVRIVKLKRGNVVSKESYFYVD